MAEIKLPVGMRISFTREENPKGGALSVREMFLYSEKVEPEDILAFFNQMAKPRVPLLGFLDFSSVFSLNAFRLIVKRRNNTVSFYIEEKTHLQSQSALVFPFRFGDAKEMDLQKASGTPLSKFYKIGGSNYDFLDFMLKENMEELNLEFTKLLGKFVATGSATDEKGRKRAVLVTEPHKFFRVNLEENPSVYIEVLDPLPKRIQTTSNFPVFEDTGFSMGVDNFDALQHSLVVGTSGSGKSKALYVMLKAIEQKYREGTRIIIIDPHGEFIRLFPKAKIVNFVTNFVEPLDVGKEKTPMLTQLVSQLLASSIGQENKYSERVLFYAVHLLSSIDKLELTNISSLLTDATVKAEFVSTCDNDEVKRFFDEEYNDIYIHHFNTAILPILNFIGEYQLYLGKEKKQENLLELIQKNRVTVVSFDPKFFGRRMISFLSGAIINQMYLLAISGKLMDKPTILVMDEFPRIETKVARDILSETRKFNLYAYFSCQYLAQLNKEIVDSMVSNVRNIVAFKLNRQDAALLSSVMEIKLEEYFKKHRGQTELEESKKEMFVRLNQRECIARLYDGVNYLLPMKLKVVDMKKWGFDENAVVAAPPEPPSPSGQKGKGPGDGPDEDPDDGGDGGEVASPFRERISLPEPLMDKASARKMEEDAKKTQAPPKKATRGQILL